MRHFLVIFKQCAIWPNVFLSAGKNALTESFYLQKQYESLTTEGEKKTLAFSRVGLSCKNALSKAKRIYSSPGIFRHPFACFNATSRLLVLVVLIGNQTNISRNKRISVKTKSCSQIVDQKRTFQHPDYKYGVVSLFFIWTSRLYFDLNLIWITNEVF